MNDVIRPAEAARILRVSPKTLARWATAGFVPHSTTLGGHRRFLRDDIERLATVLTPVKRGEQ